MMTPENEGGGGEQDGGQASFYLPKDFPGAESMKPGDTISLTVVGIDQDGDLEVKPASGPEDGGEGGKPDPWEGLDEHMGDTAPEEK